MNKKFRAMLALALGTVMLSGSLTGCFGGGDGSSSSSEAGERPYEITKRARTGWEDIKQYTNNTYTSQMPDVWCEILTSDATNIDLASFMSSSFFEFNYKYDDNGDIVNGGFVIDYSAATKLEDVTADYVGEYGLTAEDAEEGHHAFAITLRNDLEWDDGTPIKAEDFVYTMSQQLSPNYLFDTAGNYYAGNYIIHNSKEYLYQGQSGYFPAKTAYATYSEDIDANLIFNLGTPSADFDGAESYLRSYVGFPASYDVEQAVAWMAASWSFPVAAEDVRALEGKTLAAIKADATMNATWEAIIGWWQTEPNEELDFFIADYTFPAMDFSEVGFFVGDNDYELVVVMDNTLAPIDDDGNLTYEAAYYFAGFPLIKKSLWEACENRTTTPWTNSYCSGSVANSASWGPYKLTNYQADTTYTVSRNDNWYGYGLDQYATHFQTDAVVCRKVTEWSTAWQLFQQGKVDGIGMDPTIATEYRNSRQAYFTPDTYTFDLNLQSRATNTETNNVMLNYESFRKAISLCLDRDDYCAKNSPSSLAALGLLNNMYYYDVPNGLVYRETDQAKEGILNAYGATKTDNGWVVGTETYTDLDEALEAMTGYNLTLARQLMTEAYTAAVAAGDYADGEDIVLTYGIETQSANTDRVKNWFQAAFDAATVGTPLEGKIKVEYFYFSSATWSEQFANGEYDLCFGAWGSAAFNPWYLLGETQISEANRYALGWDPSKVMLTVDGLTPDADHADGSYTFNLEQWNSNMQGKSDAIIDFTQYPMADRLKVLAAVEGAVLQAYYTIPVYSRYSASLMTYKCDYNSYEYNTFMGYGGMRYMTYHFTDSEWDEFVNSKGGTLNYLFGSDE